MRIKASGCARSAIRREPTKWIFPVAATLLNGRTGGGGDNQTNDDPSAPHVISIISKHVKLSRYSESERSGTGYDINVWWELLPELMGGFLPHALIFQWVYTMIHG